MSIVRNLINLPRRVSIADIAVIGALCGLIYWLTLISHQWSAHLQPSVEIHTDFIYLPLYTLFSLTRGLVAYLISLIFTIGYGYVMAHSARAEKVMLPLLDVLQSIPVLGFLPGLVLALIAVFPKTNAGLEIACVLMIFTGQVWNMTFAFYHSLRAIPNDLRDASRSFYLSKKETLLKLELPSSTIPLVWNSMMSMAGGWFFLTITEAFTLGDKDFRLPGVGSYMSVAITQGNVPAMIGAVVAMGAMIIFLDRVLWKPLVIWSRKFRMEELSEEIDENSLVLNILRNSNFLEFIGKKIFRRHKATEEEQVHIFEAKREAVINSAFRSDETVDRSVTSKVIVGIVSLGVLAAISLGIFKLVLLFTESLDGSDWASIFSGTGLTLIRTTLAVALGALWAVPVGAVIGMNAKLSRRLQPVIQFMASFPAPMLFPIVLLVLAKLGVSIEIGAIVLMLLGTQWYMLFNVIAGASSIPTDLRELFASYNVSRKMRWKKLILPALFPSIVTGAVTAAGGAWNASIVAEYIQFNGKTLVAHGLGSLISLATLHGNYALLGASVLLMCVVVVSINKFIWRRLFALAQDRFALNT
jgi:NitT/TauT family transport system permease protein